MKILVKITLSVVVLFPATADKIKAKFFEVTLRGQNIFTY